MSAERLEAIDRVVERGIEAGGYPGAAVIVGRKGKAVLQRGFGRLAWDESSPEVSPTSTIYDLASLTKVIGTTTAIMVLFDQGRISLDAPVSRYLPEFTGGEKDLVTIRQLLTHRSGLPAGREIFKLTHDPVEARKLVLSTPLIAHPGQYYEYSDLGADVLGMVVEAVSQQPLDEFLADYVFHPLGMYQTEFRPADSLDARIAPTGTSGGGRRERGEVNDENAYALGGVAGHAGLFSTAADLSIFAQMMLNGGTYNGVRIIADSTVQLFTTRAAGHRALGWDTPTGSFGSGNYLSERSYGHTGFTGTSLWIDPDRDMFVILLTNRVYASRSPHPVRVIADVRSDLSDAASLAVTDMGSGTLVMPASFRADREIGWHERVRAKRGGRARHAKSLSSIHGSRTSRSAAKHERSSSARHTAKRSSSHVTKKPAKSKHSTSSKSKHASSSKSKHTSSKSKHKR
ncbi:MAG TPA: serine hydrolase domain-containing protein [Gemmatimonadaceae bacterium]|nr:serine hydrolase domain-containing protein [Gemmatimonadaceae bacterium]